jgi:hypothetical protein
MLLAGLVYGLWPAGNVRNIYLHTDCIALSPSPSFSTPGRSGAIGRVEGGCCMRIILYPGWFCAWSLSRQGENVGRKRMLQHPAESRPG